MISSFFNIKKCPDLREAQWSVAHLCHFVECVSEQTTQLARLGVHVLYVRPPRQSILNVQVQNMHAAHT